MVEIIGTSILLEASTIIKRLAIPIIPCRNTKNIRPPFMYPRIEYTSIVELPIVKSQLRIDVTGCFFEGFSGQAAPVTRIKEPISPVRKGSIMLFN